MEQEKGICPQCGKAAISLHYNDGDFICRHCLGSSGDSNCRLFEFGRENPTDPKGSTAHVRDIKDRRWHPTEKRMFYHSKEIGKTYFFSK